MILLFLLSSSDNITNIIYHFFIQYNSLLLDKIYIICFNCDKYKKLDRVEYLYSLFHHNGINWIFPY